ncbi:MAG: TraX family protein, partial [Pseudomonadota bacterium]
MSRTSYLSHQGNSHRANYQDLFKTIAIILMIADHTGLYILQDLEVLRSMGRIVMPIFCFFVGYNYTKPKMRILTFGMLLSGLNYVLWNFTMLNMLVGIYFGQIVLY